MIFMVDNLATIQYNDGMVGNRLREVLKREGVSAYQLCKDLGLDKGQLSRFFHGKQGISIAKLEKIADYLGYDIHFVKLKSSRKGVK
jgi:transcriptional regulator with XRE-family HTH domain